MFRCDLCIHLHMWSSSVHLGVYGTTAGLAVHFFLSYKYWALFQQDFTLSGIHVIVHQCVCVQHQNSFNPWPFQCAAAPPSTASIVVFVDGWTCVTHLNGLKISYMWNFVFKASVGFGSIAVLFLQSVVGTWPGIHVQLNPLKHQVQQTYMLHDVIVY